MFFNLLELKRMHRLNHLALRSCKKLRKIIYSDLADNFSTNEGGQESQPPLQILNNSFYWRLRKSNKSFLCTVIATSTSPPCLWKWANDCSVWELPWGVIQASRVSLKELRRQQKWWDELRWDSREDEKSLLPFFKPLWKMRMSTVYAGSHVF